MRQSILSRQARSQEIGGHLASSNPVGFATKVLLDQ